MTYRSFQIDDAFTARPGTAVRLRIESSGSAGRTGSCLSVAMTVNAHPQGGQAP